MKVFIFIICFLTQLVWTTQALEYQRSSPHGNQNIQVIIKAVDNGFIITEKSDTFTQRYTCYLDYSVKSWSFRDKNEQTSLEATIQTNKVWLKGRIKGKDINISFDKPNIPWHQSINYSFKTIKKQTPPYIFWRLSKKLSPVTFKIKKVADKSPHLSLYLMRFMGFKQFFWKKKYWVNERGIVEKSLDYQSPKIKLTRLK